MRPITLASVRVVLDRHLLLIEEWSHAENARPIIHSGLDVVDNIASLPDLPEKSAHTIPTNLMSARLLSRARGRGISDGLHRIAQHSSGECPDDTLEVTPGLRAELLLPFLVEASFAQFRAEA